MIISPYKSLFKLQGSTSGKDILLVVEQISADDGCQNDGKNGKNCLLLLPHLLFLDLSHCYA